MGYTLALFKKKPLRLCIKKNSLPLYDKKKFPCHSVL